VIERVDKSAAKPSTSRELISPNQLGQIPTFWTLESRSLDSLGTISRDLGRELSLNEFLLALAPDVTQLQFSPILPDAHDSPRSVRASHSPEHVEFSRNHRQTATKWVLRTAEDGKSIDLRHMASRERLQLILETIQKRQQIGRFAVGLRSSMRIDMDSAMISGDDPSIVAITTRMGSVLQPGSDLLKTWHAIREACVKLIADGPPEPVATAYQMALIFYDMLEDPNSPQLQGTAWVWRNQVSEFREILDGLGIEQNLPTDIGEIINRETVFNATSFWRDWGRASG
jgi:hypothetical protein